MGAAILEFLKTTGFYQIFQNPLQLVMLLIACVLLYLAIVKKFEPLLLLPIAFGMLLTNLPGAGLGALSRGNLCGRSRKLGGPGRSQELRPAGLPVSGR